MEIPLSIFLRVSDRYAFAAGMHPFSKNFKKQLSKAQKGDKLRFEI